MVLVTPAGHEVLTAGRRGARRRGMNAEPDSLDITHCKQVALTGRARGDCPSLLEGAAHCSADELPPLVAQGQQEIAAGALRDDEPVEALVSTHGPHQSMPVRLACGRHG